MESRIMFSPEISENKSTSALSFHGRNSVFLKQRSSKYLKNEIFTNLRKNMPQTSNLLIKSTPRKGKLHIITSNGQSSSSRLEYSPDNFALLKKIKERLSSPLFNLIVKIWDVYGSCPIFPDNSITEYGSYEFLFSQDYQKIETLTDLKAKPDLLIISSRSLLLDLSQEKFSINEARSLNCINLYSSIISKDSRNVQNYRSFHKSPIYRLKNPEVKQRYCKSPVPERDNFGIEGRREERIHIFPYSKGRRVKEGAAGFKKPFLLFEKKVSPVSERIGDRSYRAVKFMKEDADADGICIKYSLTQNEYLNIINEYNFLKENGLNMIECLLQAYTVKPEILKAVNPKILDSSEIELEDYLKFHVIVVLRRGNFKDLLIFVINLLETYQGKHDEILWISKIFGKNYNLVEKALKIKAAVRGMDLKARVDPGSHLQDIGLNILDLRLMVTLVIKSFN